MGRAPRPNTVSLHSEWTTEATILPKVATYRFLSAAEFRGPGVHHQFDDSDEYDADLDHRSKNNFGPSGQVILLGDGSDPQDLEMFDQDEEDKDLSAQVRCLYYVQTLRPAC